MDGEPLQPQPQPPPAVPEPPAESEATAALRQKLLDSEKPTHIGLRTLLFVVSLGAFIWFMRDSGLLVVALIVAVLLFHEGGHFIAMKVLGYENMKVFFVPFLGAAVSGRAPSHGGWRAGVVSLAGPVPGILLAAALAPLAVSQSPLRAGVLSLLFINGLNLLPFTPLDGGRLMNTVLFARHRVLEMGGTVIGAIGLVAVPDLLPGSPAIWAGVMAGMMFNRLKMIDASHRLRAQQLALDGPTSALPEGVLWQLHGEMSSVLTGTVATERAKVATIAALHEATATKAARGHHALLLAAVWAGTLGLGWLTWQRMQHPAADWRRFQGPGQTWSAEFPAEPRTAPLEQKKGPGVADGSATSVTVAGLGEFTVVSVVYDDPNLRLENSGADLDAHFDALVDDAAKRMGWAVTSKSADPHHGWPARTVVFKPSSGPTARVMYVAGGRQLDVVTAGGTSDADASRFIDSFRVLR